MGPTCILVTSLLLLAWCLCTLRRTTAMSQIRLYKVATRQLRLLIMQHQSRSSQASHRPRNEGQQGRTLSVRAGAKGQDCTGTEIGEAAALCSVSPVPGCGLRAAAAAAPGGVSTTSPCACRPSPWNGARSICDSAHLTVKYPACICHGQGSGYKSRVQTCVRFTCSMPTTMIGMPGTTAIPFVNLSPGKCPVCKSHRAPHAVAHTLGSKACSTSSAPKDT